jgi:hypothetical protein
MKFLSKQPFLSAVDEKRPNSSQIQYQKIGSLIARPEPKGAKNPSGYRAQRVRNLYDPKSTKPFKLSRSKLELFLKCSRCFYLDRKLGVAQPPGYPFTLNNAVDALLKKEFDAYREQQKSHPLCLENDLEVVPFKHEHIERWRNSLHAGVQYVVPNTNLMLYGGLDDIWIDKKTNELIVVDYKATSKNSEITLDADWQIGYKRQAEIYQWLLRKNGFTVSETAYFVYCNGKKDLDRFDKQLIFDVSVLPYHGDDSWVEAAISEAYKCLNTNRIPEIGEGCDYCTYWEGVRKCLERAS